MLKRRMQMPVVWHLYTNREWQNDGESLITIIGTEMSRYLVQRLYMPDYNMVGVAVAMVITTMHEKSCIDSHNAWKFENGSKIQSFTHLAIAMMKLRKYHSHEFLKVSKLSDAIFQKALSYTIQAEFLFELT